MTQEEKARLDIDEKLIQAGWAIQDMKELILSAPLGVAVREFPTSTGEVDYALFVEGKPVGIVETKREENGIGSYIVRTVYSPRIPCAFPITYLSSHFSNKKQCVMFIMDKANGKQDTDCRVHFLLHKNKGRCMR